MANTNDKVIGIGISLGVNGGTEIQSAIDQIQDLNKNIAKTGKADVVAPMKSLKQELKQALTLVGQLANAGQQSSKAFVDASRRVGELRNSIDEMNLSIQNFNPDNKFRIASSLANGAAKAVQGYTGALSFIGVEGQNAEQALLKLQGIMAFSDAIDSLGDIKDSFNDLLRMLGLNLTATNVQTTANAANTVSTEAQTVAQVSLTGAIETTTFASKALKIALATLGIGALVLVVSYLVSNWQSLKTSIVDLFPSLNGAGEMFNRVKNIAVGVGSAIVKFLIAPFKILGKVLSGDMTGALKEFNNGIDFSTNYAKGKLAAQVRDAKAANRDKLESDIKYQESRLKLLKASGKDTTVIERDILNKKLQFNKEDKDKFKELQDEKAIFEATTSKKISDQQEAKRKEKASKDKTARDKEKADVKTHLDELKKNNEAALRVIAEASTSERKLALDDIDTKYKKEFEALEKRKKDIKDYNLQFSNLTNARKIEEQKINKKYDDDINLYLKSVQGDTVSSYQKTIDEINKVIDEKLKNATPEQAQALNSSRTEQVNKITTLQTLDQGSQDASMDLKKTEDSNRPDEKDTPQEAATKIANINAAKLDAENAAFELKKAQLAGQNDQLAQLEADHQSNIGGIKADQVKSSIDLDKAEKEAKLANLDAVSGGLNALASLAGENTVANKALGVSSAVIDTYVGANKAFAQGGFLGFASAAAVIASGLANVKKILSVKVPGSTATGSFSAPQINSTVLGSANNGTQKVVDAIQTDKQTVLEAVITEKSMKQYEAKKAMSNNQSKY